MTADRKKAHSIGCLLIWYQNSLAKHGIELIELPIQYAIDMGNRIATLTLDAVGLRAILADTSPDPLAAEQELVMAWRSYTQEREQQIACGEFHFCSSPEEIGAARHFSRAREIVFDPANVQGVAVIESKISATIEQDVLMDAIKWQSVAAHDVELKNKIRTMYQYGPSSVAIPLETLDPKREEFVEGNLLWCKSKSENQFRKYFGDRLENAIRTMLEEHRDHWAQRPTEPYDDGALNHIFAFSIYGGNYGLGSLFGAWDLYLKSRISAHESRRVPFESCTDEEKSAVKDERRKRPIEWPHSHPNAREIIESHIRSIIREDIIADIGKWERHKRSVEVAHSRYDERRLARIQGHKDAFISKVRDMFGNQVLGLISREDVERLDT